MLLGRRNTGFLLTCSLLLPGVARAEHTSRPDPRSPAGFEYQLPLDQARRDAAPAPGGGEGPKGGGGGSGSGGGRDHPAPLFGAGITRGGAAGGAGGSESTIDSEQGGDADDSEPASGLASAGGDGDGAARLEAGDSIPGLRGAAAVEGGGSTDLTVGAIALAVVVAGGALGLALRRGLGTNTAS